MLLNEMMLFEDLLCPDLVADATKEGPSALPQAPVSCFLHPHPGPTTEWCSLVSSDIWLCAETQDQLAYGYRREAFWVILAVE